MRTARSIIRIGFVLAAAATPFGCDPDPDDPFYDESMALSFRPGGGIWIGNGLEDPDVSGVNPAAGLATKQGLDPNGSLLADATGIEIATYLVECALPLGQSIAKTRKSDGLTIVLAGALGLSPEWKDGACDSNCQEWVSACMLARTNVTGESIPLWLSADHPAIGLGHGTDYPLYEATFYGNLFQDPDAQYLCRGTDAAEGSALGDYLEGRTCGGLAPDACGFTPWGHCNDADRCLAVNGLLTACAAGSDPLSGARYRSISTFVAATGWQ